MSRKLLSIQSHVVHGYVGNKAATFPLQLRGWDVDALNTVQFSNHPAYGAFAGIRYPASEVLAIYKEMLETAQVSHNVLLTGYVLDADTLNAVRQISNLAKLRNPKLKWFLDPILGDNGKLYVQPEILPIYKSILTDEDSAVFLVTPNQFEMELLTEIKITSLQSLAEAIRKFHQLYPLVQNVVVTSVELSSDSGTIICAASSYSEATNHNENSKNFAYFKISTINGIFFGSGDLFSALLADSYIKNEEALLGNHSQQEILEACLSEVLTIMEKVLKHSYDHQVKLLKQQGEPVLGSEKIKVNDLRIIQSKQFFLSHEKQYQVFPYTLEWAAQKKYKKSKVP